MIARAEVAASGPAPVPRAATERPAHPSLRLVAYVVDWLVTVILGSIFVSLGGLQLYLASDRGTRDAPEAAIYAFLIISLLTLPVWLAITFAGWAIAGRSPGKLATGLRIVTVRGERPGVVRALLRLVVFALENVPVFAAAVLISMWGAARGELPRWALPAGVALLAAGFAAQAPALLRAGGRPLHDRAAGTAVVEE
jgi:uncharacterized RDD family membrane protein YckC